MERIVVSSSADVVALCVLCQGYLPEQSLYLVLLGVRGSAPQNRRGNKYPTLGRRNEMDVPAPTFLGIR